MKIVTFNLRTENGRDGLNAFENRRGFIIDRLEAHDADIIGFQEITPGMNDFLRTHMDKYTLVGCGRNANYLGEHNPVAFKKDRFELIGLDVSWLSETPFVPGSRFPVQSSCPRIITHTILRPLGDGAPFHFYNTHLDHVSSEARVQGATQLLNKMREDQKTHPFPLILTGDFNAEPDKPEIRMFTADPLGLTDQSNGVGTTWHGYGTSFGPRIDYIFTRGFTAESEATLWTEQLGGLYLSDHYAVEILLHREDGGTL